MLLIFLPNNEKLLNFYPSQWFNKLGKNMSLEWIILQYFDESEK